MAPGDPERAQAEVIEFGRCSPLWADDVLWRRSMRRAIGAWRERQDKRRTQARTTADVIHTAQDEAKAARSYLLLSGWAIALGVLYGYVDKTETAAMWMLCAVLLIANAEKALRSKEAADIDLQRLSASSTAGLGRRF